MTPIKISDHIAKAQKRVLYQFLNSPKFLELVSCPVSQVQILEDMFFDLFENRTLENSTGVHLDRWGVVLNEPRFGLNDSEYRIQLLAKVARNNSEATPEDIISMFKTLTRADSVLYSETYPAEIQLQGINVNPIGDLARIRTVLNFAKPAGVEITNASVTSGFVFSFDGDFDPNSLGFGDLNDTNLGGEWATLI